VLRVGRNKEEQKRALTEQDYKGVPKL